MIINRTVVRYILFALGPTYVIGLLTATTTARAGGNALVVALTIGCFHASTTYAKHLVRTIRYDRSGTRWPTTMLEVGLIFGVLAISAFAGRGPGPFGIVVPPVDEFFKSLWTTAFIAVLAAIVIARTKVQVDIGRLVKRSRREVGADLVQFARSEAGKSGVDPDIAEAILLTENLQRPGWFRYLERIKGRFFPHGTYGVMQVWSERPLTDKESISRAMAHLDRVTLTVNQNGYYDYRQAEGVFRDYNDNPNFVSVAENVLSQIWSPRPPTIREQSASEAPSPASSAAAPRLQSSGKLIVEAATILAIANLLIPSAQEEELQKLKAALDAFVSSQTIKQPGQPSSVEGNP